MIFAGLGRVRVATGRQSTLMALAAAVAVAIAGAAAWGLIALLIHRQLSLIGLLIGAGVGSMVARYRAGHLPTIVAGAVIAVAGCALGTLLGVVFTLLSDHFTMSQILSNLSVVARSISPGNLGVLGVLFYALAAFAAIRVPLQSQRRAGRPAPGGAPFGGSGAGAPDDSFAGDGIPGDSNPDGGRPGDQGAWISPAAMTGPSPAPPAQPTTPGTGQPDGAEPPAH
jgi:hypothetical protein